MGGVKGELLPENLPQAIGIVIRETELDRWWRREQREIVVVRAVALIGEFHSNGVVFHGGNLGLGLGSKGPVVAGDFTHNEFRTEITVKQLEFAEGGDRERFHCSDTMGA